jgi:hypothetical protein
VTSTYPREIILPGDRHDNDKIDITKIKILPTEDEIRSNQVEFLPSTDPTSLIFSLTLRDAILTHIFGFVTIYSVC